MKIKKYLLVYPLLILPINLTIPNIGDSYENVVNYATGTMGVYKDPNFTQENYNFSPGEVAYVKVETPISGSISKDIKILDSDKNIYLSLDVNTTGGYVHTASFIAPSVQGIYYIDINIKSEDGNLVIQRNINVGDTSGDVLVNVKSENSVNVNNYSDDLTSEREVLVNDESEIKISTYNAKVLGQPSTSFVSKNLFQKIIGFIKNILSFSGFFK